MADFASPKTPGGQSFGTIDRFRLPKTRSPGPLAYEPETSINFSASMLSRSSSQPAYAFREKFTDPVSAYAAKEAKILLTPLRRPPGVGEAQLSSRIPTQPSFSMARTRSVSRVETPSPLKYTLPRARVYEARADRSFGTEDRFGSDAPSSSRVHPRNSMPIPGPSTYDSLDSATRSDSYTLTSIPFSGRKSARLRDKSPGPCADGDGFRAKDRQLPSMPAYTMALKRTDAGTARAVREPLQPAPGTYDARSLYWNGKRQLGRSGTAPGTVRSPTGVSVHKDVQASQTASGSMPRIGPVGR